MTKRRNGSSSSFYGAGMTTTASITLVLLLFGLTILIGFMGKRLTSFIKENLSVTIELSGNMKEADIVKLEKQLEESVFVKSVHYLTKENIKQQLIIDLGKDPEEIIGYNPASDCFEIFLKADYANPDSMLIIEKTLKGKNVVQSVIYNQEDLEMLNANLSKIVTALLALAIILMFISFTLIRNTIRLNIYSKRFIINTMQLVGATDSFIRKPFIKNTILCGVLAAILANVIITVIVYSFTKEYRELISIIHLNDLLFIYGGVFISGILITWIATRSAVNKYLKMKTNNLYYI